MTQEERQKKIPRKASETINEKRRLATGMDSDYDDAVLGVSEDSDYAEDDLKVFKKYEKSNKSKMVYDSD